MNSNLERNLIIIKSNILTQFLPHLFLTLFMLLLSPLIMGTKNLEATKVAAIYELYLSLLGIILITPIFLPELNKEILQLISTKVIHPVKVWVIRLIYSVFIYLLFLLLYGEYLRLGNSDITLKIVIGGFANGLFLGGLGMLSIAIFYNIAIGYMIPMIYFITAMGLGDKLGIVSLFTMRMNDFTPKPYLAIFGLLLILASLIISHIKLKD